MIHSNKEEFCTFCRKDLTGETAHEVEGRVVCGRCQKQAERDRDARKRWDAAVKDANGGAK
jgi:hypothetical protein